MSKLFINIYDYFASHRVVMWTLMGVLISAMVVSTLRLHFNEDINSFFPNQHQNISRTLASLKQSNRLVVFVNSSHDEMEYEMMDVADSLIVKLRADKTIALNSKITERVDEHLLESVTQFIYDHLPSFIDEQHYLVLDSLSSNEAIEAKMLSNFNQLTSAVGGYIGDYIYRDPLGLSSDMMQGLQSLGGGVCYRLIDGYIFSDDGKTLMFYIDPIDNRYNTDIVKALEANLESFNHSIEMFEVDYFGSAAVAYYNARQIKLDSMITLNIALVVVAIFILLSFRRKRNVLLIILPVIFGVLFSLSIISLTQGSISLIAVGSGSIIFGLAFSYAIHLIAHAEHAKDIHTVIRELVYPLTIGGITTIGAFLGLMFTHSQLLQDFGLFASLSLVGTTIFSLVFLPQFIQIGTTASSPSRMIGVLDSITSRVHDRNKFLIISLVGFGAISAMLFNKVSFDSDMMNLNYDPPHLKKAQQRLEQMSGHSDQESNVLFLSWGDNQQETITSYESFSRSIDSLVVEGAVESISGVGEYIVSLDKQHERLAKWREFWSPERVDRVESQIAQSAHKLGFETGAFAQFTDLITKDYSPVDYGKGSDFASIFSEWVSIADGRETILSHVQLNNSNKERVYAHFMASEHIVVADRAYFAGLMAKDVSQNFYLVLYISGILIFSILLLSYGRFELAIISFMPMFTAWIVIIGLMSIFNIKFNIVTIILSTFIFGIGDDFSIFVMDGLQRGYRDRSGVLSEHKRAIIISALSLFVGMGVLIFARHPAMYSLGLISLIGMAVVVLVTYTISPLLYRILITKHTSKGNMPFTILSFLNTFYAFGLFVTGCFVVQLITLLSRLFIYRKSRRQQFIHLITSLFTRTFMRVMVSTKLIVQNPLNEQFKSPVVVIANHQSFIDILIMLSLNRKLVMVTNSWVWNNVFFGPIVQFLGFFHTAEGYERSIPLLRKKVEQGYSIVVFPEGTRSEDNTIKRFHKGAFYIAEELNLDILPILLYGTGLVSSKRQALYIKHGQLVARFLPRISSTDMQWGEGYRARRKTIYRYFTEQYQLLYDEFNRATNSYFRDSIIKNYIYKGPVLEWYMRIKLRLEQWYDVYDRLLARRGHIVDLGCGYGAMSYMLMMLSDQRRITAVDYDQDKIAVAKNSYLKSPRIDFECADIRNYQIPSADGYIISDVLHYIDYQQQRKVIEQCIEGLAEGGVIIIRDGDSSQSGNHRNTERTEMWSTKYLKFNKSDGDLHFLSREMLFDIAEDSNMSIRIVDSGRRTSNTLFVITHKEQ